jgi:hypothetical protein
MCRFLAASVAIFASAVASCAPKVNNCDVTNYFPAGNPYDLEWSVSTPANCPVPLANPGTEVKRVAVKVWDHGQPDMGLAFVNVENSAGQIQRGRVAPFLQYTGFKYVQASIDYVAATGTQTVSDYDKATIWALGIHGGGEIAFGTIRITYQASSLSAQISGPETPRAATQHTWYAATVGGIGALTYQWYRNGVPVGAAHATYTANTGTEDFELRVDVTDQTWSTRSAVYLVEVDGVRVTLTGPTTVYYTEGPQLWSAAAIDGTAPYTYEWYLDGTFVGGGSTWQGYPGEGAHLLLVLVRDAAGKTSSRELAVFGIGDGGPGCQPVPPQVTCDPGN